MSRRGWVLFVAMGVIWGIPYLLIKVAVTELEPAVLVLARTGIGAAILLPIAAARKQLRPLLRYWRPLLAYTAVEICAPWLLLGYAERELTSSMTGLLIAAVPLVGAIMVHVLGDERLDRRRIIGLLVGMAGVATLVGFDIGGSSVWSMLAVGGVVLGYAAGPIILARRLGGLPALGVIAASLAITAIVYTPAAVLQWPTEQLSTDVWLSVGGLAIICTAIAFFVFFQLIAEVGPARATVITYINPAVALALGVLILDEPFTAVTVFGFAMILVGSVLATAKSRRPAGDRVTVPAGQRRAV